jgi:hypothetical protein
VQVHPQRVVQREEPREEYDDEAPPRAPLPAVEERLIDDDTVEDDERVAAEEEDDDDAIEAALRGEAPPLQAFRAPRGPERVAHRHGEADGQDGQNQFDDHDAMLQRESGIDNYPAQQGVGYGAEDDAEPCAVIEEPWPAPSNADMYCFASERRPDPNDPESGAVWDIMMGLFDKFGTEPSYKLCVRIYRFYEEKFRGSPSPEEKKKYGWVKRPEWTLNSIKRFMYNNAKDSNRTAYMKQLLTAQLAIAAETGMVLRDSVSGLKFVNIKGTAIMLQLMSRLQDLQRHSK